MTEGMLTIFFFSLTSESASASGVVSYATSPFGRLLRMKKKTARATMVPMPMIIGKAI